MFRELSRDITLDGQTGYRELPKGILLDGEEEKTFGGEVLKGAKKTGAGIVGLAETGAMLGSGLIGSAVGGVVGLRKMIAGESPGAATEEIGRISESLTYKPQTEWGKHFAGGAEYGMEKITGAGKFVGEKVQDVLSKSKWTKPLAPYLATAADTGVQLGIFGAGARLVKPGTIKPVGKEAMRVSPEEIRLEKGLRVEELPAGPEQRLLPPGPKATLPEKPQVFLDTKEGVIEVKWNAKNKRYEAEKASDIERIAAPKEKPTFIELPKEAELDKPPTITPTLEKKVSPAPSGEAVKAKEPPMTEGGTGKIKTYNISNDVSLDALINEIEGRGKSGEYFGIGLRALKKSDVGRKKLKPSMLIDESQDSSMMERLEGTSTVHVTGDWDTATRQDIIKGLTDAWERVNKYDKGYGIVIVKGRPLKDAIHNDPGEAVLGNAEVIGYLNLPKFIKSQERLSFKDFIESKGLKIEDYPGMYSGRELSPEWKKIISEHDKLWERPTNPPELFPKPFHQLSEGGGIVSPASQLLSEPGEAGKKGKKPGGIFGDEAGFIEIPVEDLRRAGKRFSEFWRPMSTLPQREQILKDRGKALGGVARVERVTNRVFDNLKVLDEQGKKDIFQAMSGQREIFDLSPEHQGIVRSLLRTNDLIGEMLVKRGIITVDQFNAHKGEYIRYMYLRHSLGDDARIVTKPNGKLDLSYQKHRKDLTWEQRRELGIIEDVSVAQPLGMAKALGDTVKYDYLEKLADDPRNVWTPSLVEITDIPKEFTEKGAKAQATYISRTTGDKYSPVHIGKDRWIVWNEDTGTAVGRKMSIGDLVEEVGAYRQMDKQAPNTPEIQYRLNAYEKALQVAKEGTQNVPEDFIQMPSSKHWGPLSGAFIRKEIARDLMSFWGQEKGNIPGLSNALEKMAQADEKMTGVFKVMKVPLNLPTAVRNIVSNVVQLVMSGRRPDQIVNYGIKAVQEMITKSPEYTRAFRNGLFKTNWSVAELNEVMSVFRKMEGDTWGKLVGGMHDLAKYYGRIDDIFKMIIYLNERGKGVTIEKAVMEGQKWGMDYSLADPSIKWARKHFIPFASYTYKIIPLLVESAIKRPWVLGSLMALPYAVWEASKAINSEMSESDWKNLQNTIPKEVKERGTWMLVPVKINNKWRWFDYSYFLPWGNIQGAIQSAAKGDIQGVTGQLGIAGTPLLTLIKTFAIDPVMENPPKDPFSGQALYNHLDPPILKAGKTVEFIYNSFAPSMMTRFGALGYTASIGKEDRWGRTIDVPQALGRWFGVNLIEPNSKASGIALKAKVNTLRDEFIKISVDPNISADRKEKYRQRLLEEINELVGERNK